jgi:hypothetical protein
MAPQPLTVHVRDDNSATLICPGCGLVRQVPAARFRNDRHTLSVRCRCGHVYNVLLDFRRHFRKPTSLAGTYNSRNPGGPVSGVIRIVNISRSGVGFTVSGRHRFEPGQELQIEFQLTDRNKSVLKKPVVVRMVQDNTVGCEFLCTGELDKALGFFLQG